MHNTMELLHQMRSRFANVFWQALQMAHEGGPIAPTDLLRKAANGLERLGRYGEEAEEARHALVAAGVGRGDRGGRNAGHREKGERDSGRGQPCTLPLTYCAKHGEGQGHNTSDCIVIRREFDRHNGDFHQYADRFPGGHGHERNRHHFLTNFYWPRRVCACRAGWPSLVGHLQSLPKGVGKVRDRI